METYQEAAEYLGKKDERPVPYGSPRATVVRRLDEDTIGIVYHGTPVVVYHANGFTHLNTKDDSGKRWTSATTKTRINDYSPSAVIQRDKEWFLMDKHNERVPFVDGITIGKDGYPLRDAEGRIVLFGMFEALV